MTNSFELVEVNNDSLTASSSTEPLTTAELIKNLPVSEDILPKPIKPKKNDVKPKSKPKTKAKAKLPLITETSPITVQKVEETDKIEPIDKIEPTDKIEIDKIKTDDKPKEETAKVKKSIQKLQEKQECPHCKKSMSLKVLRYTHPNKCTVLNKVMNKKKPTVNNEDSKLNTPAIIEQIEQEDVITPMEQEDVITPMENVDNKPMEKSNMEETKTIEPVKTKTTKQLLPTQTEPVIMKNKRVNNYIVRNEKIDKLFNFLDN